MCVRVLKIAFTLQHCRGDLAGGSILLASRALQAATLTMPAGFFLGGLFTHGGDPGLGVLLVAPGGLLILLATFLMASRLWAHGQ